MATTAAPTKVATGTDRYRALRWATVVFVTGWLLHSADHARRGTEVVTRHVQGLGVYGGLVMLLTVTLVFTGHRWAPHVAAFLCLPGSLMIAAVHLLPSWGVFSDAFPGGAARGVSALSWAAVLIETAGKLAVGLIGVAMLVRDDGTRSPVPSRT